MPSVWTAELDARLFYVLVEKYKVSGKGLADGWKKKYDKDNKPPTASAIDQHIAQLRKKAKDVKAPNQTLTALPASSIPSTPNGSITATPRKPATPRTPKTPATGNKRKRAGESETEMSDDDESEPELSKAALANLGRRTSTPRSIKTARKTYKEDSTDDEEDEEGEIRVEDEATNPKIAGASVANDDFNDLVNFDGPAENELNHLTGATPLKKLRMMKDDFDDQSDASDWAAGLR